MSTPGTPLPGESYYDSQLESPTAPLAYCPYDPYETPASYAGGPTTFLNYRNPEGSAIGGSTTGNSGTINQTAYQDPSPSAEFHHRKGKDRDLGDEDDDYAPLRGADPSRRRTSSYVLNGPVVKDGSMGHGKTGHDAMVDVSNSYLRSWRGRGTREWSEQPLVLGLAWVAFVGVVYVVWKLLGEFNKEGKGSVLEIL